MTARKFCASASAILSHVKYASDTSKLFLVETLCLPVLSYTCESLNFSRKQLYQLNVCWNNIYRKKSSIFCERVKFVHLYAQRKLILVLTLFHSASDVLRICAYNVYPVT